MNPERGEHDGRAQLGANATPNEPRKTMDCVARDDHELLLLTASAPECGVTGMHPHQFI